jgi:hypothetical protein
MSDLKFYLLGLSMLACIGWQGWHGVTGFSWLWKPRVTREDEPGLFWVLLALQAAVLSLFLATARRGPL